jgi:LuxR family quorum-sensing system transcriptional regulator CciR
MNIFDFVECSNQTHDVQKLFALLVKGACGEGFDFVAYGALTYHEPHKLPACPDPAVVLNYPAEWQERYFEQRYQEIDPVVIYTPMIARPFLWSSLADRRIQPRKQRLIFDEAREFGLKAGVSVPIHGPCGKVAVVSFASKFDDADPQAKLRHLTALAFQFHVAFADPAAPAACDGAPARLSARERDCLAWIAEGKTSWDIGVILTISENTVNFHLKNAMRKLETGSRTAAVLKAARLGLIDLLRH